MSVNSLPDLPVFQILHFDFNSSTGYPHEFLYRDNAQNKQEKDKQEKFSEFSELVMNVLFWMNPLVKIHINF